MQSGRENITQNEEKTQSIEANPKMTRDIISNEDIEMVVITIIHIFKNIEERLIMLNRN